MVINWRSVSFLSWVIVFWFAIFTFSCSSSGEIKSNYTQSRILSFNGLKNLEIGMPFKMVKSNFPSCDFKPEPEFWGYSMTDSKASFNLFLNVYDDTLQGITIFDSSFALYNGLRVGDNIEKVRKAYPGIYIYYNNHDSEEEFVVHGDKVKIVISITPDDDSLLGIYQGDFPDSTSDFRSNGKINSISIYRNL